MQINSNNDIRMVRGDSESITVSCEQHPFEPGDEIVLTIRKTASTKEKTLQKIVKDFEDGKAVISFEPGDTAELAFGEYIYDIQLTFADGTVKTIIKPAKFFIGLEVTYE